LSSNRQKGWEGERIARDYLEGQGFEFLTANYYTRWGEIDLVMRHDEFLVFVEVKSYQTSFMDARYVINKRKKRNLFRSGEWYRVTHDYDGAYRFDLCVLDGEKVVDYIVAMDVLNAR